MSRQEPARRRGPAWLGIGAQRSGTTWFTELLTQHPQVNLRDDGEKELHQLYLPFHEAWGEADREAYRAQFRLPHSGEFTPYYLRAPWVPHVAREVLDRSAPIIVLLRDPVDRYESAVRLGIDQGRFDGDVGAAIRAVASDAAWGGMYATHLSSWANAVGRRRLVVLQYERARNDPQAAVTAVWRRLGLDPVDLTDVDRPSRTVARSVEWSLDGIPGLRDSLRRIYVPEVRRLRRWGIDRRFWRNFSRRRG